MEFTLPQPVNIRRLFEALNIEMIRENALFEEDVLSLPIRSIMFQDKRITLPFMGEHLRFEPQGNLLQSSITGKTQNELNLISSLPTSWPVFCERVTHWIEREQGRILASTERFHQRMIELLIQGYGFSILQELKNYLKYDVFLLNKQLKVIAWEGGERLPFNTISFVTPKLSHFKSLDLSPETPLSPGDWNDPNYKDLPLSWYPLAGQQGVLGYIGLGVSSERLNQVERLFLHKTATLLYLELAKAQSIEDTERQHYRDFLFDLLYNNFDSIEVIQSRGKLWGMDLTKPHFVVVGEIPGFDPDSTDRVYFQELLDNVTLVLRSQPQTIFLERNNQIVLLFPLDTMLPLSQWHSTVKQFLTPLLNIPMNLSEERQVIFGLGNLYASTRNIHRSFQEAKSALELGRLFHLKERVISFQDLGVMRLLLKLEQQELEDFRTEVLGPLLKFDQENNLHLEETLLAYLSADGDLNLAGDKLFLHPNTLRYRLKKAAEVLDRDLASLENRINLYVALKIGRLKALWHD